MGAGEINRVSGFYSLFKKEHFAFLCCVIRIPKKLLFGKKDSEAQDWKPLLPRGWKSFTGDFGNLVKAVAHLPRHVHICIHTNVWFWVHSASPTF